MNEVMRPERFPLRVLGITAGLSMAGALAGAGVGLAMTLITGGFHGPGSAAQLLFTAASVGAACGAVLFPAGAWTLMRRVPLGRALLWTLIPSAVGAALSLAFLGLTAPVGVAGATIGFAVAALGLRRSAAESRALPGRT